MQNSTRRVISAILTSAVLLGQAAVPYLTVCAEGQEREFTEATAEDAVVEPEVTVDVEDAEAGSEDAVEEEPADESEEQMDLQVKKDSKEIPDLEDTDESTEMSEFSGKYADAGSTVKITGSCTFTYSSYDSDSWIPMVFPQNGVVSVCIRGLSCEDAVNGKTWGSAAIIVNDPYYVTLTNSEYNPISGTATTLPQVGVEKGVTYYLAFDCENDYQAEVTVVFTPSGTWETELNGDRSEADAIKTDTWYYGTTSCVESYDYDYYEFQMSSAGYVTISFKHDNLKHSNDLYNIELVAKNDDRCFSFTSRGKNTSKTSAKIGLAKGIYYIRVVNSSSEPSKMSVGRYGVKVTATKAANWESECNGTQSKANAIKTNTWYYGTTSDVGDYDEDWYKFTMSSAGYVTISFKHDNLKHANDLYNIELVAKNDDRCFSFTSRGKDTSKTSAKIGLAKGTYYIRVVNSFSEPSKMSVGQYGVKVTATKAANWESERNDTWRKANAIKTNTWYYGTTSSIGYSDEDWYKFTMPSAGYVTVSFKHDNLKHSNDLYGIDLVAREGDRYSSLFHFTSRGKDTSKTSAKIGLAKGTYYICVVNSSSEPSKMSVGRYGVKVTATKAADWESENNNDKRTADKISLNKAVNGTTSSAYDVDIYKFTTSKDGYVNIAFSHSKVGGSGLWSYGYAFFNGNRFSSGSYGSREVDGKTTYSSITHLYLKKGTHYLYVMGDIMTGKGSTTPYQIKVSMSSNSINAPKAVSAKSEGYNAVKLSWKAVSGADSYQIYRSTSKNGTYEKVGSANGIATSYTDKRGVTAGKKYYYKIKSVGTVYTVKSKVVGSSHLASKIKATGGGPQEVISGYSNVVSGKAVPKTPGIKVTSPAKKQAKVTWKKVSGASGYEVYYSTQKNKGFKKAATVKKGSATSYTQKSKLSSKKTYYYKVRAYRNERGKKIYSSYSSVKQVKTQ